MSAGSASSDWPITCGRGDDAGVTPRDTSATVLDADHSNNSVGRLPFKTIVVSKKK